MSKTKFLALFICLLLASVSRADPQLAEYLNSSENIRVVVTNATGFGHQVSTLFVMDHLPRLGFRGHFHVVYHATTGPKLEILIPGFKNWKPEQTLDGVLYTEENFFRSRVDLYPHVRLAITGGNDYFQKPELFNADTFLSVQPSRWNNSPAVHFNGEGSRIKIRGHQIGALPIPLYLEEPLETEQFVRDQLTKAGMANNASVVLSLLASKESVTGYGYLDEKIDAMTTDIQALLKAQDLAPQSFQNGIVFGLFNKFSPYLDKQLEKNLKNLDNRAEIISAFDSNVLNKMASVPRGHILVVKIGNIPPKVLDYCFTHTTWSILEGANAQNLMNYVGKGYKTTVDVPQLFWEKMKNDLTVVEPMRKAHMVGASIEDIAKYFLELKNPNSLTNMAFKSIAPPRDIEHDKVAQVLLAAMAIEKTQRRSCAPQFTTPLN
jgi:hypothetical protein